MPCLDWQVIPVAHTVRRLMTFLPQKHAIAPSDTMQTSQREESFQVSISLIFDSMCVTKMSDVFSNRILSSGG